MDWATFVLSKHLELLPTNPDMRNDRAFSKILGVYVRLSLEDYKSKHSAATKFVFELYTGLRDQPLCSPSTILHVITHSSVIFSHLIQIPLYPLSHVHAIVFWGGVSSPQVIGSELASAEMLDAATYVHTELLEQGLTPEK